MALIDTLNKMELIDIYRTFHPKAADYTFFSSVHGTFSRIDHVLGHETSLGKFKKIEIILSTFSNQNGMRQTRSQLQGKNCQKHKHIEAK